MAHGYRRALAWLLFCTSLAAIAFSLGGCAAITARAEPVAFNQAEAAYIFESGKADIRGEAFFERSNGKVLRARGRDVALVPRTARADEWFVQTFGKKKITYLRNMPDDFKSFFKDYARIEITSSGGRFAFKNVADGDYYLITRLLQPSDYAYRFLTIMERVRVEGGKDVRVVMRGF